MFKAKFLTLILLIVISFPCFSAPPVSSAQAFWSEFRQAVIENNYQKLISQTQFPLAVHGEADFIPVKKITKDNFKAVFEKVLAQEEVKYNPQDGSTSSQTIRDVVINTIKLPANKIMPDDTLRISDLVFEYKNNSWKLVQTYLIEE